MEDRAADRMDAIVRIGFPWWLRFFVSPGTVAITLGRRIYIGRFTGADDFERLLDHELVHVRQARELGLFSFLRRYLTEYLQNRRRGLCHDDAYRAISFEAEAFAAELVHPYNRAVQASTHDAISRAGDPAAGTLSGASEGGSLAKDRH